MTTIIGIDAHISTCDYYAVGKDGVVLDQGTVTTNAPSLRQIVTQFKGKEKIVVLEQSPLSAWIGRIVQPRVSQVIFSETRRNRWIAKDPTKNDRFDAEKLTALFRGGFIKEVVQKDHRNEEALRLVLQHHDLVRQRVRVKNKIKAKFRENGVRAAGISVFTKSSRKQWLLALQPNESLIFPTEMLYRQLDMLNEQVEETDKRLAKLSLRYPIIKVLIKTFPGIGLINAATFVAIVDTPERFPTVKKFWTYCGLGLDRKGSGMKPGTPRLTNRGNRLLKCTLKQATMTAVIQTNSNRYKDWYQSALESGKPQYKVLLTCSRKLAKDMWLVWKQQLRANKVK